MERITINYSGVNGENGTHGNKGLKGSSGSSGESAPSRSGKNGKKGTNAGNGTKGGDGGNGTKGLSASNVNVKFSINSKGVIEANINEGTSLLTSDFFEILATGGNGGKGGNGGDGGSGGDGGDGGSGGSGQPGKDGKRNKDGSYSRGTDGKDGGDGGDGGNGGSGSNGGNAGNGANAGDGAKIEISVDNPFILNRLLLTDSSHGIGGKKGIGGTGGKSGDGGSGGSSGSGGSGGSGSPRGSSGRSGSRGINGSDGSEGSGGTDGISGKDGRDGETIISVVYGKKTIQKKFNTRIENSDLINISIENQYIKTAGIKDGIFSPGDEICFSSNIKLSDESFPIPENSRFIFKVDGNEIFSQKLSAIQPGDTLLIENIKFNIPENVTHNSTLECEAVLFESADLFENSYSISKSNLEIKILKPVFFKDSGNTLSSDSVKMGEIVKYKFPYINFSKIKYGTEQNTKVLIELSILGDNSIHFNSTEELKKSVNQFPSNLVPEEINYLEYEIIMPDELTDNKFSVLEKIFVNDKLMGEKIHTYSIFTGKKGQASVVSTLPSIKKYLFHPFSWRYNFRRIKLLLTVGNAVLWADGVADEKETKALQDLIDSLEISDKQKNYFKTFIADKITIKEIKKMSRSVFKEDKKAALVFGFHLAMSDQVLHEKEIELLSLIQKLYKINDTEIEDIKRTAEMNRKAFSFRNKNVYFKRISPFWLSVKVPIIITYLFLLLILLAVVVS